MFAGPEYSVFTLSCLWFWCMNNKIWIWLTSISKPTTTVAHSSLVLSCIKNNNHCHCFFRCDFIALRALKTRFEPFHSHFTHFIFRFSRHPNTNNDSSGNSKYLKASKQYTQRYKGERIVVLNLLLTDHAVSISIFCNILYGNPCDQRPCYLVQKAGVGDPVWWGKESQKLK